MDWQPIETAPHDGRLILCWPRDDEHATAYWSDDGWRISCCGQMADNITHWMPLPEPPPEKTAWPLLTIEEMAMILTDGYLPDRVARYAQTIKFLTDIANGNWRRVKGDRDYWDWSGKTPAGEVPKII